MALINVKRCVEVKYLQADIGVRYWEDAEVNGKPEEDDNPTIPCRRADGWRPVIDLDTGKILGWPAGVTAKTHYKVCDAGRYTLLDADCNEVISVNSYVPKMLSPGGDGFGDYVIMTIGPDGVIENWRADLSGFGEPD